MAEPRPLASLTAGLLARKGQARPATVRPVFAMRSPAEPPAVVAQQARLAEAFSPPVSATARKDQRIALTLRLDEDRHLQLKLIAARRRKSAQALLIDALDEMFAEARNDSCVCGVAEA